MTTVEQIIKESIQDLKGNGCFITQDEIYRKLN